MSDAESGHSIPIGYLYWIFGFMGAHRFYYGRPVTGTIWFFTLGLLGIGWIVDLFLIPSMDRKADLKFMQGPIDTGGLFTLGVLYDYWTLNRQISEANGRQP